METISNNQQKVVVTLSGIKLNLLVLVLTIPLWLTVSGTYVLIFGYHNYLSGIRHVLDFKIFLLLFLGIPIHELLHALTWMVLQREGFKNIRFGFNWESLTPYTVYKKPMIMWKYRWGGAMPGLLMGIIPVLVSLIFHKPGLNFVGFLFIWAAMGDVISLWMTRKFANNKLVKDHPDDMGVIIL